MAKNLPAMWKTQVLSLCWEDPLEKGMADFWEGYLHQPRDSD